MNNLSLPEKQGLYDPQFEHDACGVGFVCQMKGKRTHEIIQQALTMLVNLDHRGACGCEVNTGDGAGILLQLPHGFFAKVAAAGHFSLPAPGQYAVGMLYVSPDPAVRAASEKMFEEVVVAEGQTVLGWRTIPTDNSSLGKTALQSEPAHRQVFIGRGSNCASEQDFERKLFVIRKVAHYKNRASGNDPFWYAPGISCRTVIYKGMLMPEQVGRYFLDLSDPSMETALAPLPVHCAQWRDQHAAREH